MIGRWMAFNAARKQSRAFAPAVPGAPANSVRSLHLERDLRCGEAGRVHRKRVGTPRIIPNIEIVREVVRAGVIDTRVADSKRIDGLHGKNSATTHHRNARLGVSHGLTGLLGNPESHRDVAAE